MGKKDARVDAYIAKSATFAQPILNELRDIVHEGCPEVEEAIKWSMPFFLYKGMLCHMAAFKQHCAFGFWNARRVLGDKVQAEEGTEAEHNAMGQFGRLTSLKDLPSRRVMVGHVKKAKQLHDEGKPAPAKPRVAKKELPVPAVLAAALKKNKKAAAVFEKFPPSHRREYIEWITDAKTDATREKRLATTIEWLTEGKSRNWKYQNC